MMFWSVTQQDEHIMVTSAPTMSIFTTSSACGLPLVAARLAFTLPYRIPIQVSGKPQILRRAQQNVGRISSSSRSMSGW